MDNQDKIWDEILGFLAWKFKETKSGDMYCDSDEVIPELKGKYLIKTFESFISEGGLGALSMIDDAPKFNPVMPPDTVDPTKMNINYTGGGRVPQHWLNSPFLSGSVYGAGDAHTSFGYNPSDTQDVPETFSLADVKKYKYKKYNSLDELKADYEELVTLENYYNELGKSIKNDRLRNIIGVAKEFNKRVKLYKAATYVLGIDEWTLVNDDFNLNVSYEVHEEPTPGSDGDYYNPPDPGESGSYTFMIDSGTGTLDNLMSIGFSKEEAESTELLDLQDIIIAFSGTAIELSKLAPEMKAVLDNIDKALDGYESDWNDSDDRRDLNLYDDFDIDNVLSIIAIKYILSGTIYKLHEYNNARNSRTRVMQTISNIRTKQFHMKRTSNI